MVELDFSLGFRDISDFPPLDTSRPLSMRAAGRSCGAPASSHVLLGVVGLEFRRFGARSAWIRARWARHAVNKETQLYIVSYI